MLRITGETGFIGANFVLDWLTAAVADDGHPYVRLYAQCVVRDGLLPASN